MTDAGYDYFEHTADIGIRGWGPTLDEAFAQAARGLIGNMVEIDAARPTETIPMQVEGENVERLLFTFLDDVLDLFYTKTWVPAQIEVHLHGDTRLEATLRGEPYDAARHGHVHEIKAMTWHGLEVHRSPPQVRVIVDI